MSRSRWLTVAGYGGLAAVLLFCLWLIQLMPIRLGWGRELLAASIAIVAMGIGVALATRRDRTAPQTETAPAPAPAVTDLSVREREVLALLARGLSNKELARELSVSENTVKTHLANLYAKLGARRRTEALAAARRLRLPEAG